MSVGWRDGTKHVSNRSLADHDGCAGMFWGVNKDRGSSSRDHCFAVNYDVATFSSSDTGTGSPWSGAIVITSSFKRWIFRYKLTLFTW